MIYERLKDYERDEDTTYKHEVSDMKGTTSFKVQSPKHWSSEIPNLYRLLITLKTDSVESVKTMTFGFRDIEIIDDKIYVNGKTLFIRGVNRHDFDPETAWHVPDERYDQDLSIMKAHNKLNVTPSVAGVKGSRVKIEKS